MIPFYLKTSTTTYAPSLGAWKNGVTFDAQENAAISLPVMMSGKLRPQMLPFGTLTISVQGSGEVNPDLDELPLGVDITLYTGRQSSMALPASIVIAYQTVFESRTAPEGYQFAKMSISEFAALKPARVDLYYEPILHAMFAEKETYRGDNYHRGDFVYALVPLVFDKLKVNYFPIYQGYIVQPVKVTTAGLESVSWSFEFVTNIDRSL